MNCRLSCQTFLYHQKKAGIVQRHTITVGFAVLTKVGMMVPAKPPKPSAQTKELYADIAV